jgi:hypothetical protein
MKKVGKVALKAAPIAAMFIPGVGPLASMAISAASNAASKKIEGGSWKSALGAGAIGAATGYAGGALKAAGTAAKAASKAGSIAPSAGVISKAATVAPKVSALGKIMGGVNTGLNVASPVMSAIQSARSMDGGGGSSQSGGGIGPSGPLSGTYTPYKPSLNDPVNAGRLAAAKDQGFRKGYDITAPNATDPTLPREVVSRMPKINTDYASMGAQPPAKKRKTAIGEDGGLKMRGNGGGTRRPTVQPEMAYY